MLRRRRPVADRPVSLAVLLRCCHPEPTAAVTALSVALAASSGRRPRGVAAVGAAVLAGQLSIGWHNDWLDADSDRAAGRADKPLANDERARLAVGRAAGAALCACVPLSLLSGAPAGAAHVGAVALAWGYNAGLKRTAWSWVPYAGSFPLLVSFIVLGRPGRGSPARWALAAAALLGVGAHLANAVPDLEADASAGVVGLPHRLGPQRSATGAAALLVAASAVVALGPGDPGWSAAGLPVAGALVAGGLVAERRGSRAALFRASMAVALLDAGVLVARGSRL